MSDLAIPSKVLDQHLVCLGKTGAGKSSVLRHIVEHFLSHKKRVCVIDPKGDWWGLKLSADGKSEGFPVITFGDFKERKATDIPINDRSGKHVAELIVSGNRPCIIGCRGWMPAAQGRFWIDFASTIFNSNQSGGLNLIIDEIQNFAPKERTGFGEENMALHWTKRILSEGRGLGLTIFCGSQRPQSVHNGVLTQCETLVGMRLTHDADCSAVETWLKRTRDKAKREEVLISIPEMPRGEGWVWSPEIGFGPERVKFPMFTTFDSFAPPQLQKKVALSDWSSVDLEEVKNKLASVVEEAKANDPAELKRTIADLKHKLTKAERATPKAEQKPIEVPILDDAAKRLLEKVNAACDEVLERSEAGRLQFQELTKQLNGLRAEIGMAVSRPMIDIGHPDCVRAIAEFKRSRPRFSSASTSVDAGRNGDLTGGARQILIAAAQYPEGVTDEQIAVLTGYKKTSRSVFKQRLMSQGYIAAGGMGYIATAEGLNALGKDFEILPTGAELRNYWMQRLGGGELAVFQLACDAFPGVVNKQELEASTGYKKTSLNVFCQRLSARRLITSTRDGISANKELFE